MRKSHRVTSLGTEGGALSFGQSVKVMFVVPLILLFVIFVIRGSPWLWPAVE